MTDAFHFTAVGQEWDRREFGTWPAGTNEVQCLDSNASGDVYYIDCNDGDYQLWSYGNW